MRTAVVGLLASLVAACGGPGSFNGMVQGRKLDVQSSFFYLVPDDSGGIIAATLYLSDRRDTCANLRDNRITKNLTYMTAGLLRIVNGVQVPPEPGEYTVYVNGPSSNSNAALSTFYSLDANCRTVIPQESADASSGRITIEGLVPGSQGRMVGTFDLTFGNQRDRATGDFSAQACDLSPLRAPSCE